MAGHVHRVQVRMSDAGQHGLVAETSYFDYLQDARAGYLREVAESLGSDTRLVVASKSIDCRRPVDPLSTEELAIDVRVTDLGTSSFTMAYEVRDGESVVATAESVQVAWDPEAAESRPVPGAWRRGIEAAEPEL